MNYKSLEINKGVKLHYINTDKFKTNLFSIFITTPLKRETVTLNALLPMVLKNGTSNYNDQKLINIKMEELYGADFNCGVDKNGDNITLKFYLEFLNKNYLPNNEDILKECVKLLTDIVFNPYISNDKFFDKYVETEKENLKQIIEGKIDDKGSYAFFRCIEEMYKDEPYGLYKFGYVEDLDKINAKELYNYYLDLINNCKIDIFLSGNLDENAQIELKNCENILNLKIRDAIYNKEDLIEKNSKKETTRVNESMDVGQGKLIMGLDCFNNELYTLKVYNVILGGGANSKLFQNVREKASLCYYAASNYNARKANIFIRSGIEIKNYDKAVDLIEKQLNDMQRGNFTDEDIENAKKLIFAGIRNIKEEQDTEIMYYFDQEFKKEFITLEDYKNKIINVNKEDIVNVAKDVKINTIYFLRD